MKDVVRYSEAFKLRLVEDAAGGEYAVYSLLCGSATNYIGRIRPLLRPDRALRGTGGSLYLLPDSPKRAKGYRFNPLRLAAGCIGNKLDTSLLNSIPKAVQTPAGRPGAPS
jgi:hypothetical protein